MVIPELDFFIFGAGARHKFLYRKGQLLDVLTDETVFAGDMVQEVVNPPAYTVRFTTAEGDIIVIREDEHGIMLEHDADVQSLSALPVNLPTFEGHPHETLLRILHHEILVNILPQGPVPNLFAYSRPWYREAAMAAMVLQRTGNLHLIRDWVRSLCEPFDQNNAGVCAPDNLGQILYLIALTHDQTHPLVPTILTTIPQFVHEDHGHGSYISGLTDGAPHPIYQTQWLKFGLRALGLDDPFVVPWLEDSYAALCWWASVSDYIGKPGGYHANEENRPHLAWAEAHFFRQPPPLHLAGPKYPLSWEAQSPHADYEGMRRVALPFEDQKLCMPHSWHAAEMFLYLYEQPS
ncbi:MAG: hypothetical protein JXA21_10180 [Anaerolineae bacterium]|nr:hypothetical protein [Anaerolineae bacterium]